MNYFGQWSNLELVRQDGTTRLAADVLNCVPYVVLLFGAAWESECAAFMDVVGEFYEAHHEKKGFEVVYISRDYNKADMMRGFLLSERAAAAAQRRVRQERKDDRERSTAVAASGREADSDGAQLHASQAQRDGQQRGRRRAASRAGASPSTPPPLRRVAELTASTATTSGLVGASDSRALGLGQRRGFWAVPYDHVGCVGVPILYHLRVFTYPGVIVCRNKPYWGSVPPALLPTLPERPRDADEVPVDRVNAPQRRQRTPVVARPECRPEVVTIAGRFMMERDPAGDDFPWERMNGATRWAALLFFLLVTLLAVVVISWALPTILIARQTALLKAEARR
ncbi:tryparedoxin-like protein [Novymonas esmeraldas]|uniref:Tryparedoxin-like protein n=1 Tax=Novymonas esmeraldas TaxID=1808958 RepID=A0AAW0F1H4_9TRYP